MVDEYLEGIRNREPSKLAKAAMADTPTPAATPAMQEPRAIIIASPARRVGVALGDIAAGYRDKNNSRCVGGMMHVINALRDMEILSASQAATIEAQAAQITALQIKIREAKNALS